MRAILAAVVLLTLTGCGGGPAATPAAPKTLTVTGDMQGSSIGSGNNVVGAACVPYGAANSDVRAGAQVTVTDESGKVMGLGTLGAGVADARFNCLMRFTVANVPAGRPFYGVQVVDRPVVRFTAAQVAAGRVHLKLAD